MALSYMISMPIHNWWTAPFHFPLHHRSHISSILFISPYPPPFPSSHSWFTFATLLPPPFLSILLLLVVPFISPLYPPLHFLLIILFFFLFSFLLFLVFYISCRTFSFIYFSFSFPFFFFCLHLFFLFLLFFLLVPLPAVRPSVPQTKLGTNAL